MLVAPSLLSADFGNLSRDVQAVCDAGCDLIHIDVMDGHFVPNHSIGTPVISAISKVATKPLDIHLMVENNTFFVDLFKNFKPRYISFHIESEKHPHRLLQKLRSEGIGTAIALNPHTRVESIEHLLAYLDMVLLMSVNPGFGGQRFIPTVLEKSSRLKNIIQQKNYKTLIEVDGGVTNQNIKALKKAGVDIAVSGSYIFKHSDLKAGIDSLRV
jgi:ribulose-phosphate 3-epimerase